MHRSIITTTTPRRGTLAAAALATFALLPATASAQSRSVVVNGQRLADTQVQQLARMNCSDIPDGRYWINTATGVWGYAGNPQAQGVLGDGCRVAQAGGGVNRDGTHGPFATMRRAQEFADGWRARGFRAVSFHNGDGYYVRVSR